MPIPQLPSTQLSHPVVDAGAVHHLHELNPGRPVRVEQRIILVELPPVPRVVRVETRLENQIQQRHRLSARTRPQATATVDFVRVSREK